MTEGQTNTPPSLKTLLGFTVGSALVATVLTIFVVLPAEFGRDPTGFGHLTGLIKLSEHEHVECE
jgi:hypothetical protein